MKTEDHIAVTVGVTGIRKALVGALEKDSDIVTVDADDGKHKYCWRLGWELTFPVTGRGVQIYVSAGLCRQSFRLKMLQKALFEA